MITLKRYRLCVALGAIVSTLGATALNSAVTARRFARSHHSLNAGLQSATAGAQSSLPALMPSQQAREPIYETRSIHDPNGTGRFYMGREIAQMMGPGGIPWLDRPGRDNEERPETVIDALELREGDVVADLGAGSGYFTFRMAPKVGKTGKVLAVEIQDEMLEAIRKRAVELKIDNVEEVKDTETNPKLPPEGVDLVLMVDVYHELSYPFEVMTNILEALKPGGRVAFVEYRKENPLIPIKEIHKMTLKQLDKEMKAVGLARVRTVETLPSQHIAIYARQNGF